jgi:hypothetical protein|tara:strand:+ start:3280 stop:4044 length:765 start_codon:yes stop_codon:yes gene_type:complete
MENMPKIIGFSGYKQSGKTTSTNFLYGYQLRVNDVIQKFLMNPETGELLVNAMAINEKGEEEEGLGVFDIERRDSDFVEYASQSVWPYVRSFGFADPLKIISIQLFGLSEEQCYGTNDQKNTPVDIKWEDLPSPVVSDNTGFVTAREFLQYFGTEVCRKIKSNIWVDSCVNRINQSETDLAIVSDVRFPNEVEAIQKAGGKVIRLTRKPHKDVHDSETSLDSYEGFDYVLDNQKLGIDETNKELLGIIKSWGWA